MKNIPTVKLGIIAVSRDCFPMSLSASRRSAVVKEYAKYGEIFECTTTVENEKDAMKALSEVNHKSVAACGLYL